MDGISIDIKTLEHSPESKIKLVELRGKLDMLSSPELSRGILPRVEQGDIYFILDLGKLEYIDSAGIYALLQVYTRLKEKKGYVKLIKLNKNINETLSSIGVTKILPTYQTLEEALKT